MSPGRGCRDVRKNLRDTSRKLDEMMIVITLTEESFATKSARQDV
jgi:hypothetical protein